MSKFKIVLFAYNFPHRKTMDFIHQLYEHQFSISLILAADFVEIKSPKSLFTFPQKIVKDTAEDLAKRYNIPFYTVIHNSTQSQNLLKKYNINFGIISGARILSTAIIQSVKKGILNLHPGILPHVRGLDSILWSIDKSYPIGVTAHLITDIIDSGQLIIKKSIIIRANDNLLTLYEKNYQLQLKLLPISLNLIFNNKINDFKFEKDGVYKSRMSYDQQIELKSKIHDYIKRYSKLKKDEKN